MREKCNKNRDKFIRKKAKIIKDIYVYQLQDDARSILEDALSYPNTLSEDGLEYRERDLKRHLVNYIRHDKTNYESGLLDIHKVGLRLDHKWGDSQSYFLYKNATLSKISQAYPYLKEECDKQMRKIKLIRKANP